MLHGMTQSAKGKLAADALKGGLPADLVKRTRVMLSAPHAALVLENLRFPPGNRLKELERARVRQHSVRINK